MDVSTFFIRPLAVNCSIPAAVQERVTYRGTLCFVSGVNHLIGMRLVAFQVTSAGGRAGGTSALTPVFRPPARLDAALVIDTSLSEFGGCWIRAVVSR